jgi:signal transduction histidine kinase
VVLGLACVFALGLVIWIKTHIWERLGRLEHSFATIESEGFLLGLHVRESVVLLNGMLLRYQLSGDASERDSYRATSRRLEQRFSQSGRSLSSRQEQELADKLAQEYRKYTEGTAELLERPIRGVRKESVTQVQQQIEEHAKPVLALADELASVQRSRMKSFFAGSRDALVSLQGLLWLALVLLFALIASVAALSYKALVDPLRLQLTQSQSLVERHEKLASLGALAAGVAHEIRNPLTAIKFRLFSLKKALPGEYHDNEDLGTIASEVNRLERIVKDFLQFARPSEPSMTEMPVPELLEQTVRLLRDELKGRGVELSIKDSSPVVIRADRQQIQQVLINLIQNGAESIPQGGTITLGARAGAAKLADKMQPVVILDVADTGRGIPPEAERRLFDPFYSTKENGTGLGLPIAARIIERHAGLIHYATRPNHGTTFSIVLPAPIHESKGSAH